MVLHVGTSFSTWPDFANYVGYFSDRRVEVSAASGGGPFGAMGLELLRFGERKRTKIPHTLVWEIPSYSLVVPRWLHWSEYIWRLLPATGYLPVAISTPWRGTLKPGAQTVQNSISASLPEGQLFHSGNGELALRLRGELSGGTLQATLWCGEEGATAVWMPGDQELVIPLMGVAFAGPATSIHIRSQHGNAVKLNLIAFELVSDLSFEKPVSTTQAVSGQAVFSKPQSLSIHSAVAVRFSSGAPKNVRVAIHTTHSTRTQSLDVAATENALALISVEPQVPGEQLLRVEVLDASAIPFEATLLQLRGGRAPR
jgi:hypothetical protein